MVVQKDARRIRLEQLADRARKENRHLMKVGASIAVLAFVNARDANALVRATDAVEKELAAIESDIGASNWNAAANRVPGLRDRLVAFADAAGIPYDSRGGGPAPKQLVDQLDAAIADSDTEAAAANIEAIRTAIDAGPATTNAKTRATTGPLPGRSVFVNGQRVALSASEVAACRDAGARLQDFAANKIRRASQERRRTS